MNFFSSILMAVPVQEMRLNTAGSGSKETLVVLGASVLVGVLVLVWAFFYYRRHRRARKHQPHHHHRRGERGSTVEGEASGDPEPGGSHRRRRRRRRRRRDHLPRNPTLAETGGLPPVREGDPPGP